jgi:hypothetical protein
MPPVELCECGPVPHVRGNLGDDSRASDGLAGDIGDEFIVLVEDNRCAVSLGYFQFSEP